MYNSANCLERYAAHASVFRHIVLVDNASSDGTAALARQLLPQAQVLALTTNIGFGPGNNRGLSLVRTPFTLFLNPDCVISADDLATLLQTKLQFPSAMLVGPKIVSESGVAYRSFEWGLQRAKGPTDAVYPDPLGPVSALQIDGACMLVDTHDFTQFGAFNDKLFMFFEEIDLGLRATRSGRDVVSTPFARAVHLGGASSASSLRVSYIKAFHLMRSRLLVNFWYVSKPTAVMIACKTVLTSSVLAPVWALLFQFERLVKVTARARAAINFLVKKK
jgi:N-acetylglucosaminyl-diphospho-decaprenol L-rhamnosyltransferase